MNSLRSDLICTVLASAIGAAVVCGYGLALGSDYAAKELAKGLPVQFLVFFFISLPVTLFLVLPALRIGSRWFKANFLSSFSIAFAISFLSFVGLVAFITQAKDLSYWLMPIAISSFAGALALASCRQRHVA